MGHHFRELQGSSQDGYRADKQPTKTAGLDQERRGHKRMASPSTGLPSPDAAKDADKPHPLLDEVIDSRLIDPALTCRWLESYLISKGAKNSGTIVELMSRHFDSHRYIDSKVIRCDFDFLGLMSTSNLNGLLYRLWKELVGQQNSNSHKLDTHHHRDESHDMHRKAPHYRTQSRHRDSAPA